MSKRSISLIDDRHQKNNTEDSASIEEQVAEFLKSGGKIEQIASGVSGMESMATRQPKSLQKNTRKTKKS
ncbi:hypothetical protein GZ77_25225 [Endozoicomonas montiporae]|uniref:Transcriptional regulator SutA RNAP-binding domain-containing protein n=2 Tax=Endozoicomonas montiporae TaxID=1027273 RepID=A0A081MYZ0_9GAMM|nr:hypothetical protein [Endozoicomonas montiporae]AMO54881.1 hypothetical protein EZMO1_0641 [Endozoicomonas montiporae CL-33]KEQ11413.1 hypothetical protein GZ77_25225 [Endozoicomonas montiporae]